jgi:hypothetical protein
MLLYKKGVIRGSGFFGFVAFGGQRRLGLGHETLGGNQQLLPVAHLLLTMAEGGCLLTTLVWFVWEYILGHNNTVYRHYLSYNTDPCVSRGGSAVHMSLDGLVLWLPSGCCQILEAIVTENMI